MQPSLLVCNVGADAEERDPKIFNLAVAENFFQAPAVSEENERKGQQQRKKGQQPWV